jgi:nucleoid DNA-binding protein
MSMSEKQFTVEVQKITRLPKENIELCMAGMVAIITATLKQGGTVDTRLGKFRVRRVPARIYTNFMGRGTNKIVKAHKAMRLVADGDIFKVLNNR